MPPTQNTRILIINSAIEALKTIGTEGLTLRKVASGAGISLGNLQYHFKDKTALFGGLGEFYFAQCTELLEAYKASDDSQPLEKRFQHLILFYLDHVDELTDMCRIFRELWALATRDAAIHEQLNNYYALTTEKLEAIVIEISGDRAGARRIVALLLPYFEGYSITHEAIKADKSELSTLLSQLCCGIR